MNKYFVLTVVCFGLNAMNKGAANTEPITQHDQGSEPELTASQKRREEEFKAQLQQEGGGTEDEVNAQLRADGTFNERPCWKEFLRMLPCYGCVECCFE